MLAVQASATPALYLAQIGWRVSVATYPPDARFPILLPGSVRTVL